MKFTSEILHLAHSIKAAKGYSWSRSLKQAILIMRKAASRIIQQVASMLGGKISPSKLSIISGQAIEICKAAINTAIGNKAQVYTGSVYVPADFTA